MKKQKMKNLKIIKTRNKSLANLLDAQYNFGKQFCDFKNLTLEEKEKWTKEFILCCSNELNEILDWINWKHWKTNKKKVNIIEVKYEIIDLLHFVLSLMLVWDMDEKEIFDLYFTKNKENFERQKKGY